MFDDGRGLLTRIDVRLVQKDGDLNKSIGGSDLQLYLLSTTPAEGPFSIPKIVPPAPRTIWPNLL
jgi:hypothetical protein